MDKFRAKIINSDIEGANYAECSDTRAGCASLNVENLSLSYGSLEVFKNITVRFSPCTITSIVGPSGCGKTSFLKSLNRLSDLHSAAKVSGSIQMGQIDITSKRCDTMMLRRRIGMIFQRPSPLPFSIFKNIDLPLKEHGFSRKEERKHIIEQSLRAVGLWDEIKDRLNKSALELSGGQQQRLCIARTLSLEPEVILMDEPCSALDPISSGVVEDLIISLRGNYTVIVVTHNLAQARRISDEVAFFWIQDGCGALVEHASAEQIFNSPRSPLTHAYISGERG